MSKYALTPLAKADVNAILSYIDADSVDAGNRVEQAIFAAGEFLARAPLRGHVRRDLTKRNVRF
jgi:plasmid stabilization system protein ParE